MNAHIAPDLLFYPQDPMRTVVIVWAREQMGLTLAQVAALPGINCSQPNIYRQHRRWENWAAGFGGDAPLCLRLPVKKRLPDPPLDLTAPSSVLCRGRILSALEQRSMTVLEVAQASGVLKSTAKWELLRLAKANVVARRKALYANGRSGRRPYRYSLWGRN